MSIWRTHRHEDSASSWSGTDLVNAAELLESWNDSRARSVAFAVAQAARDEDDDALPALTILLTRLSSVEVSDHGTLVNALSALQFTVMRADSALADWIPPQDAVARTVRLGLMADEAVGEQTNDLLWGMVNRWLISRWLGHKGATAIAAHVGSPDLRHELLRQANTSEHFVDIVPGGAEFPCIPA